MGSCSYCGADAGFFRTEHQECAAKYANGMGKMVSLASQAVRNGTGFSGLEQQMQSLATSHAPVRFSIRDALIKGWESAIDEMLNDTVITAAEEAQVMNYVRHFSLTQPVLNVNGAFTRLAYGCALRDVLEKGLTSRAVITFQLPFNLMKNEQLIWCFRNVPCFEEKIYKSYVGQSQGVSVRVMKGVYYRVGSSRGYPVETSKTEQIDTGMLGITTQHIYFAGSRKSFRIPYKKVVSFTPYADGLGVCRDAASAKPQTFITGEGWFIYNLVMNLSRNA